MSAGLSLAPVRSRLRRAAPQLVACATGVWLMAAPAVVGYEGRAAAVDRSIGPLVAALSFVALWELGRGLRRLTVPLGLALLAAPLLLWYGDPWVMVNSVVSGLVVMISAVPEREPTGSFGGGWRAAVEPPG